jgi:serine/threonine-protein kinase RsbW
MNHPPDPKVPALPTRCLHGPRCQAARAECTYFECAAFPPNALVARRARRLAKLVLAAWNLSPLEDEVAEVVSELTTNALVHGRIAVRVDLRLYITAGQLVFEVEDRNPRRPILRPLQAARRHGTGFGLRLVADIADDWGFEYFRPDHKRVWAAWDLHDRPADPPRGTTQRSPAMTITEPPKISYPGDRRTWTVSGDPACSPTRALVLAWCRGTITGPWGLPESLADAAATALNGMIQDPISRHESMTVRIFRASAGRASIVTVIVDDKKIQFPPVESAMTAN